MSGKTAIVTGATSGIGLAIADLLASQGTSVYLCARDADAVALTVKQLRDKGYEVDGKRIEPYTTIAGAYEHAAAHGNSPPYVGSRKLMQLWSARSCGLLGAKRWVKYDGAPTTVIRTSGPIRTAIMPFPTMSPNRTPASKRWATMSVRP